MMPEIVEPYVSALFPAFSGGMPYECHIFADSESHGRRGGHRAIPIHLPTYGGEANSGERQS
jgi:hypothetical protein